jgi:23S rRNA pseudouridine1911/1915/1917 synthase
MDGLNPPYVNEAAFPGRLPSASLPERVLYEDNHLLVINKLPGEICQGDKTGDEPLPETIKAWIKIRDRKPGQVFLGVVHRLDRPASGLVLFAKTSKALERLNASLKERNWTKTYLAITARAPTPPSGALQHHLLKDERRNQSRIVQPGTPGSREARLSYRTLASLERYHLLEVELETGRHHQIRVQLAALDCPLRGDLKYGAPRSNPDGSVSLHAWRLTVQHPVRKEPLMLQAPPLSTDAVWAHFAPWWQSQTDFRSGGVT